MKRILCCAVLIFAAGQAAAADSAPAAQPLGGPAIAGVCMLSQQAILGNAKVGVAASARLRQLAEEAQSEVSDEQKSVAADARALEGKRASLKPADFDQQQQALATRAKAVERKAADRSKEIELTRQKALARISGEAQPVIAQVYKVHSCGLLIDRNSVLGGNMANDLTADVVKGLDARITTITFDREKLPAAAPTIGGAQ